MFGSALCLVATSLTTYASFGVVLARGSRGREHHRLLVHHPGRRHFAWSAERDVERLLGALTGAFGHRDGVRVILLPDRVTPKGGVSMVRSQVAVVVGRSMHLIAIPPLGAEGLQISGSK